MADNIYAINMSPHKYGRSYVTIGGYYEFDYEGELYWYSVESTNEWNLSVPKIKLGDTEFHPIIDGEATDGNF